MTATDALGEETQTAPRTRWSSWLTAELSRLDVDAPGGAALLRTVGSHPERLLVPLALVACGALAAVIPDGDAAWFRAAGASMVGPRLFDVFSAPGLQIGPLYLMLLGLATKALTVLGSPVATRGLLGGAQAAGVVWFAMWTTRRAARLRGHEAVAGRWAVGLLLGLGGFAAEGIGNGHPEEILVALLLCNAALSAVSDRHVIAGAVLAAAVGLKQWGAFGGGILLLHRGRTGLLRGASTLAGLTVLLYGPFFLFGTVRTFDFTWGFGATSYLGSLGHAWGATDWQLRFIQGGMAGLAGAFAAWRRPTSPFLPVVCAVSVRLLIDPLRLTYYSGALVAVLAVWAWSSRDARVTRLRVLVTALTPLVVLGPYVLPRTVTWFAGTGLLVAVLAVVPWLDRPQQIDRAGGRGVVSHDP